jgi:hypothetical protein
MLRTASVWRSESAVPPGGRHKRRLPERIAPGYSDYGLRPRVQPRGAEGQGAAHRSGRLASGARSWRGACPSQSSATRRAPWKRARKVSSSSGTRRRFASAARMVALFGSAAKTDRIRRAAPRNHSLAMGIEALWIVNDTAWTLHQGTLTSVTASRALMMGRQLGEFRLEIGKG